MSKKRDEVKKEEVKYTAEDFNKELDELSKKTGFKIVVEPVFFQQDNGSFSLRIVNHIVPIK